MRKEVRSTKTETNQTFTDLIRDRSIWRQARENMQPGLGAERTLNNNVQQTKEKKGITSLTANGFSGRLRRFTLYFIWLP